MKTILNNVVAYFVKNNVANIQLLAAEPPSQGKK